MNWSRAKTILIILFLCTNIFLLATILLSSERNSVVTDELAASTVQILEENGIEISPDIIPRKTEILPVIDLMGETENKFNTPKAAKKIMKELGGEERIEPVKSVASVLVDFVSHPDSENTHITALEQGYSLKTDGERHMLTPSWKLTLEDGREYVLSSS